MERSAESCVFHWGNLAGRNRATKSSKPQTLVQATPWKHLDDQEEVSHICCTPHLNLFVLKNGKVYTLNSHHKRKSRPELVSVLQEDKIHTVDSRGSNVLYLSEAGNVYFSKLQNHKRRSTAKSFYITKPKLLSVFAEKCVVQVACGNSHSLALCKDGRVFTWGQNSQGQLGIGNFVESVQSPQCVTTLAGIPLAHAAAGKAHTIVVSRSGVVFGWGGNRHGQLGLNDVKVRYLPTYVKLLELKGVIYVSCGAHHTAVLNKDGLVFTFGAGNYGQLGHNSTTDELVPRLLDGLCGIKVSQIACGSYHTLVYSARSRKLYSFGQGQNGHLGSGGARDQFEPRLVPFSVEAEPGSMLQPAVKRIFAGADQSFALCFGLKALPPAEDQSAFIHLKQIVTAEDSFWKAWRTMENTDLQENIKEQIISIFSSVECLNGSFLETSADDHFKTSRETPGIDLSAASLCLEKLGKNSTLLQEVTDTVIENLIPSLSKSPAGVEVLQVYLILPELIEVQREGKSSAKLTILLSTAIASLEESQLKILESWWSDLDEIFFNKLVNLYRNISHHLLLETSDMQTAFSGELHSCLSILQSLYKINSSRKPKYQEENFYISPAEVFGRKRISCKALLELIPYSCIFTMENKINIFQRLSRLRICHGELIDESIIFNNTMANNISDECFNFESPENIVASAGDNYISTGIIDGSAGNTEASTGIIDALAGNTETSTGIIDAFTGNTETSTGIIDASAGNTETSTGIIDASAGNTETSTGIIDVSTGNTETSTGIIDVSAGNTETSAGIIDVSAGNTETSTGIIDAFTGNTETSTGIIDVSAGNNETSTGIIDVSAGNTETSTGIIDVSAGNTETSTGIIDASAGNTETSGNIGVSNWNTVLSTGIVDVSTENSDASTCIVDASSVNTEASRQDISVFTEVTDSLDIDTSIIITCTPTGTADIPNRNTEDIIQIIDGSPAISKPSTRITDTSTEIDASAGNIETSTGMIDGPTGNVETAVEINVVPSENKMGSLELSAGPTRNTETFTEVMEVPTENSAISAGSIFTFDEDFEMFDEEVEMFDEEVEMFDEEVEMFGESISNSQTALLIELLYTIFKPKYALRINREDIIQSTLAQLRLYDTSTFRDALQVVFKGEEGIDQRGLSQEFFSVITKELYNQPMIFKQYEESRLLWFPEWDPKIKDAFWLLGILCWLALYHGFVADFHFPLALYKKLLHEQPTLDDLKELSPTLGRNLQKLLNYEDDDIEEVFCLNFTVGTEMADGSIIERELIPNGRNIMVRSQNRKLFVNKYVDYVFNTSVEKHFQAFSKGFRSVIPMPVVDLFLPSELMVLLHGTTEYDWIQLEENTRYGEGYTKTDEAIVNFWQMFHDLTLEDKKHFLVFLTGCDKVPVGGMNMLKIGIREDFRDDPDSYFPTGHTCDKLLDLPRYSSVEVLRERFLRAVRNCKSFGIA